MRFRTPQATNLILPLDSQHNIGKQEKTTRRYHTLFVEVLP